MQKLKSFFEKNIVIEANLFIWWRFLFGAYFIYYSVRMIPYLAEVYGDKGFVPDIKLNWTYGLFPNIFSVIPFENTALIVYIGIIIASSFLCFGYFPRVAALVIWYLETCLYNRDVLSGEPSLAYVGLLLVTLILIPYQPTLSFKKSEEKLEVPYFVFFLPVFIFCLTFTASAVDKLMSPSWIAGTALTDMLTMGITKDNMIANFLVMNPFVTSLFSYSALFVQLASLPFLFVGHYKVAIIINLISFCVIFFLLEINQVVFGMLFFFSFFLLKIKS